MKTLTLVLIAFGLSACGRVADVSCGPPTQTIFKDPFGTTFTDTHFCDRTVRCTVDNQCEEVPRAIEIN
jgi:hypothetical protein